jgi:cobalamin biosynthesis protein CobT
MNGKHDKPIEVEPSIPKAQGGGNRGTYSRDQTVLRDEAHIRSSTRVIFSPAAVSARLTMDIRKLFENSASDDWQMHRKTGSIDTRALAGGGVNMFKRRLENAGVDSSVIILLDVSASMFGPSALIEHAAPACIALMSALDSAGVESALLSFGSAVSTIKPFSKNSKRVASLLPRLGDGGGTNDYTALLHAHSLLHPRQTQRKVCFVLTDGEGNVRDTKAQALSGANLGITTIGIGIKHDVSHIYQHAVRVSRAADLGTAMFSKIKGVL